MIIKMVKLKSSFDKNWGNINEIVTTVMNEILWGKLAQEKCEHLSQTNIIIIVRFVNFHQDFLATSSKDR
jgi:hypothetical protein